MAEPAERELVVIHLEDDPFVLGVVPRIIGTDQVLSRSSVRQFSLTAKALEALAEEVDQGHCVVAIIDGIVADGSANSVAEWCFQRRVPYVRHTGESKDSVFTDGGLYLKKPVRNDELIQAVKECLESAAH